MEELTKRVSNLLTVKSLVTLILTAVFAFLTCTGGVSAEQFLTVFTVIIAFYFGTQSQKAASGTGTGTGAGTGTAPGSKGE